MKYFVVQRCDNGVWTECSRRYYLIGLALACALNRYKSVRSKNPNLTLRIARGKDDLTWY